MYFLSFNIWVDLYNCAVTFRKLYFFEKGTFWRKQKGVMKKGVMKKGLHKKYNTLLNPDKFQQITALVEERQKPGK